MVRRILTGSAFVLLSLAAFAQSPYQLTLEVPSVQGTDEYRTLLNTITSETIVDANGNNIPYDITQKAGGYTHAISYGYNGNPLFIQLPPQPYITQPVWVQILPTQTACAQGVTNCLEIQPFPEDDSYSLGAVVTTVDKFMFPFVYTFYTNHTVQYNGQIVRTWKLQRGRYDNFWQEQKEEANVQAALID